MMMISVKQLCSQDLFNLSPREYTLAYSNQHAGLSQILYLNLLIPSINMQILLRGLQLVPGNSWEKSFIHQCS